MQKADTNKDKKLSIEEFNKPEGFNKLRAEGEKAKDKLGEFTSVDGDEDGVLDVKELMERFPNLSEKRVKNLVKQADKDSDGQLDSDEFSSEQGLEKLQKVDDNIKKAKEFYDTVDTSADGQLDVEEILAKYPELSAE